VTDLRVHTLSLPVPRELMPRHIGIIMDGNGRWAKLRGRPRMIGHHQGVETVRQVVKASSQWGVEALTLYAFSDENWARPFEEVSVIMGLLETYLKKELDELNKNNVRLRAIGDTSRLNPRLQKLLHRSIESLSSNTGLILNLALSYSGRMELTAAVKEIAKRAVQGDISPNDITPHMISNYLYTAGIPDPDLVIRTSGEQRISNFLLWQSAYAEFVFTNTLWPDFSREEYANLIQNYASRERRFGVTGEQIKTTTSTLLGVTGIQGPAPC
jgi:undecaprenyl diphosphate synthase